MQTEIWCKEKEEVRQPDTMSVLRNDLEDPRLRLLVCGYTRIFPNRWNFSQVSLPFWRLYWNTAAGASIRCGDVTAALTPATAVLIRPNAVFSTLNSKPCDHLYIHFQMPLASDPAAPPLIRLAMKPPLVGVGENLRQLLKFPNPTPRQVSLVARSLIELALSITDLQQGDARKTDVRILKVLAYMDEHLKPSTSNADLAREARMSVGALTHLFKDQMGLSLQGFLRRKRVEKAALMLQFSDLSIEQIAEETGFCDRYHFSKIFRDLQSVSPAAFRRLHANPFMTPSHE